MLADIDAFVSLIATAAQRDAERWQNTNVRNNGDMSSRKQEFLSRMNWRINWLYSQWGEGLDSSMTGIEQTIPDQSSPTYRSQIVFENGQLLIQRNGQRYTLTGVRLE